MLPQRLLSEYHAAKQTGSVLPDRLSPSKPICALYKTCGSHAHAQGLFLFHDFHIALIRQTEYSVSFQACGMGDAMNESHSSIRQKLDQLKCQAFILYPVLC